jgi:hypothetical protein
MSPKYGQQKTGRDRERVRIMAKMRKMEGAQKICCTMKQNITQGRNAMAHGTDKANCWWKK